MNSKTDKCSAKKAKIASQLSRLICVRRREGPLEKEGERGEERESEGERRGRKGERERSQKERD